MKKILALLLAAMMLLALVACGGSGDTKSADDEKEPSVSATDEEKKEEKDKTSFKIGETWTVDGQWSLTINSVEETQDRNEYSDYKPAAVYLVNYSYTNIGYEDDSGYWDGLYISIEDSIVDNAGIMGYSYPGNVSQYPQETPVGATCNAQACIGVDNAGDFKINVSIYDSDDEKQKATFELEVQGPSSSDTEENAIAEAEKTSINESINVDRQAIVGLMQSTIDSSFNDIGGCTATCKFDDSYGYYVVTILQDGIASVLATAIARGTLDDWEILKESQKNMCDGLIEMAEILGDDNAHVLINILNDENQENILLSVLDGAVIYDAAS